MTFFSSTRRLAATGAALVLLAAACGDDGTGPGQLSDPAATAAALQAADDALETPVFESFSILGDEVFAPAGAAAMAGVRAVLRATNPEALTAAERPYAGSARQVDELRQLIPVFSRMASEAIFPPEVVGKTFVWNPATAQYEPTGPTVSFNGVRFVLYAIDPLTDTPAIDLNTGQPIPIGYVDFVDVSSGTTTALQVTVVGTGTGSPITYVDYTLSVTATTTSFTATATGDITNGQSGPAERRLEFDVSFSASETASGENVSFDVSLDVFDASLDVNEPAASIRLIEDAVVTTTSTSVSVDLEIHFSFTHAGETIGVDGTISVDEDLTTGAISITVNITVTAGGTFATIRGTDAGIQIRGPGGRELTPEEFAALEAMLEAITEISGGVEDLFDPVENIFGA